VGEAARSFVSECFWPGVTESEVQALEARASAAVAEITDEGTPIRYLGSILMREDEVVLCQFAGAADAVRRACELARIPFERILETAHSPWKD
jgi:hypothetical protein